MQILYLISLRLFYHHMMGALQVCIYTLCRIVHVQSCVYMCIYSMYHTHITSTMYYSMHAHFAFVRRPLCHYQDICTREEIRQLKFDLDGNNYKCIVHTLSRVLRCMVAIVQGLKAERGYIGTSQRHCYTGRYHSKW